MESLQESESESESESLVESGMESLSESSDQLMGRTGGDEIVSEPRRFGESRSAVGDGIRLPGKGNSNSHGARPVHQIISMIVGQDGW